MLNVPCRFNGGVNEMPPEICAAVNDQTPPPRLFPAEKLAPLGTPEIV